MDKAQPVRLADVLLIGPFLIYAGARKSTLPTWVRVGLGVTGAATIAYNARNYVSTQLESVAADPVEPQWSDE